LQSASKLGADKGPNSTDNNGQNIQGTATQSNLVLDNIRKNTKLEQINLPAAQKGKRELSVKGSSNHRLNLSVDQQQSRNNDHLRTQSVHDLSS
jgi:hypothetical protein